MGYSMTVYSGYLLTTSQAQELAQLHFPDAAPGTADTPYGITQHFLDAGYHTDYVFWPRPGEHTNFMVLANIIITHDPSEDPWRCRPHEETEGCRRIRERLFGPYEDRLPWLKDVKWATVPDPQMEIMDQLRDWRIWKENQRRLALAERGAQRASEQLSVQGEDSERIPSKEDESERPSAQDGDDERSPPTTITQEDALACP
ncbi:hypothetical protein PLICRDRAFT_58208 [Plicaturopsis crispa FD-325 SS-3]|uniref:Uncharacterized protein n=1 Tax=Plicaturopsis crispa FD-325 SS-3 TaxID=944288 RepID=A0A0C9SQH0_PLICR|nr:hypothetical protein PLICRDRAFT_58208 [Plicaturopsis crispa FD-325 SS-3]